MRKLGILKLLAGHADLEAATVAERMGCSSEAAGMQLLRLARQGLVRREFDPDDRVFFYSLTQKGEKRLRYLSMASNGTAR